MFQTLDLATKASKAAPYDGKPFIGGWWFQSEWVWRACRWDEYEQTFYQVPGTYRAPVTHWAAALNPPEVA